MSSPSGTPPGPTGKPADRSNAEKMPEEFEINMLRCIFCGLCQEVCPEEAIFLKSDFSLTGLARSEMILAALAAQQPRQAPDIFANQLGRAKTQNVKSAVGAAQSQRIASRQHIRLRGG